jgi:hypothetical protein
MCCSTGSDYQSVIEMLQAMYEGELQCRVCDAFCADTESLCPKCGGTLQLPLADLIDDQLINSDDMKTK